MRTPPDITRFSGMRLPSSDFNAVRNDLQIAYLFYEFDLTAAHSIAAGTQVQLPLKGNSFYIDRNIDVGNATIVFHDQSLTARPGKIFVQPGFNARIPFDVITIENLAQPGMVLRIFYGVDLEFFPSAPATVAISGGTVVLGGGIVTVQDVGMQPGVSFSSTALITGGVPQNILGAGSNPAGLRIHDVDVITGNTTTFNLATFIANATAPTHPLDGILIAQANSFFFSPVSGTYFQTGRVFKTMQLPPGVRLDFFNGTTDTGLAACRKCNYDIF